MSVAKALRSTGFIVAGILLGVGVGMVLGKDAKPFGEIGKYYIQLIKAIAAPLLFFAVIDAILTSEIKWRSAGRFLGVVLINTIIAATIGMGLANYFQPGKHLKFDTVGISDGGILAKAEGHKVDILGFIDGLIPDTIVEPFTQTSVLGVVFLAVVFGCVLKSYQSTNEPWVGQWEQFMHGGFKVSERAITWLVSLTPVAIFGVMAKSVGENGFKNFAGLGAYLGVGMLGLCLQTFVVYNLWLLVVRRVSLRDFWKEALTPLMNAFGVNSSLASLPLTLKALDRLGVSKPSSRMAACIGTNLNNDGILLYEAMAVIIVTQSLGQNLGIAAQLSIALVCVLTSLGIAGVPEAGIVSLSIILSTLGIQTDILLALLSVDWILARMRSVTNVVADMTTSVVIDGPHKQIDRPPLDAVV
jgi:Na+/H+-dicarboxylate symporter